MLFKTLLSFACLFPPAATTGAQESDVKPIDKLEDLAVNEQAFEASSHGKPLVLKSHAQARKYFDGENLKQLLAKIDFDKQVVLVFAWKGSGQDKFGVGIPNSGPLRVEFDYAPGKTRDLRPHTHIFALRSDVKWNGDEPMGKQPAEFVRVSVKGKLKTGIVAIGGETTGTTITADGITWELDFGQRKKLAAKSQELGGKMVLVRGRLHKKQGVEIGTRWIVAVRSIEAAK